MEENVVTGIAYARDEARITLVRWPTAGHRGSGLQPPGHAGINVDMIVQTARADDKTTEITFTVAKNDTTARAKCWRTRKNRSATRS